jgi:hypothetical protein
MLQSGSVDQIQRSGLTADTYMSINGTLFDDVPLMLTASDANSNNGIPANQSIERFYPAGSLHIYHMHNFFTILICSINCDMPRLYKRIKVAKQQPTPCVRSYICWLFTA